MVDAYTMTDAEVVAFFADMPIEVLEYIIEYVWDPYKDVWY